MEVNVDLLEQMDLTDVSDHEALDVFLSSVGEESSAQSPDTGWALLLMKLDFMFIIEQTQIRISFIGKVCSQTRNLLWHWKSQYLTEFKIKTLYTIIYTSCYLHVDVTKTLVGGINKYR